MLCDCLLTRLRRALVLLLFGSSRPLPFDKFGPKDEQINATAINTLATENAPTYVALPRVDSTLPLEGFKGNKETNESKPTYCASPSKQTKTLTVRLVFRTNFQWLKLRKRLINIKEKANQ
jgi:hypothetical protein